MNIHLTNKITSTLGIVVPPHEEKYQYELVASLLGQAPKPHDPIKCYDLGLKFYSGQPVELDDSDFKLVYEVIEKSDMIRPWVQGPILKALDAAKSAK